MNPLAFHLYSRNSQISHTSHPTAWEFMCVCVRERACTQTHKDMCIYTDIQNCSTVPFSMPFCVRTSCLVFLKFSSFFILIYSNLFSIILMGQLRQFNRCFTIPLLCVLYPSKMKKIHITQCPPMI